MTTELAQLITLTSYGNEFLATGQLDSNFYPNNSVFQYCNLVDFHDFKKGFLSSKQTDIVSATNPNEWFDLLKKENCKKIRLYYKPSTDRTYGAEYMLAGFAGGAGTWFIETIFEKFSHFWSKRWMVTQKDAPDNKIWSINYGRVVSNQQTANMQFDLSELKNKLSATLTDITDLAYKENMQDWAKRFEKANQILESPAPEKEYYHKDLIVLKNYPLRSRQLIFATGEAWVFGGMGWWNDNAFNDKERYERLTQQLYETINYSIVGFSNSF